MIRWNHIRDKQPERGRSIVKITQHGKEFYTINIKKYDKSGRFDAYIQHCQELNIPSSFFWWVYAEDFPFPDKVVNDE